MLKMTIFFIAICLFFNTSMAADNTAGKTCSTLSSTSVNCKDKKAVFVALNELHACMKSRFTYKEQIYSEAWPSVDIPDSGPILGGDGEWAVGCMKFWPCKDKRLAFIKSSGGEPHLVMVVGNYIVDYEQDKVYDREKLKDTQILKISGLKKDEPWFKVD